MKQFLLLMAAVFTGLFLYGCRSNLFFDFRHLSVTNIEITDCTLDETILLTQEETSALIASFQNLNFFEAEDYTKISSMFLEGNAVYEMVFYSDGTPLPERIIVLWDNLIYYDGIYFETDSSIDLEYIQELFESI